MNEDKSLQRSPKPHTPAARIASTALLEHRRAGSAKRITALARKQLDHFISLEPKVLRGNDPDAIHDIRVASRRLQQILDLLYPKPRPPKIRKLRRTIRRSRRALSTVRNCDVLMERVEKTLERKQLAHREVWTAFREYLQERRDTNFQKALKRVSNLNLPGFYVGLKSFLEDEAGATGNPVSGNHTPPSVRADAIRVRMAEDLQTLWADLSSRVEQSRSEPSAPVLHAVRIAAKRVRYLIEVIHEIGQAGSADALECLRLMQEHLGNWHDLEVMEETMLEMMSRPKFLQEQLELALETGKMVLRNRESKRSYEEKFFRMVTDSPDWSGLERWVQSAASMTPAPAQPRESTAR
jgi:CHAD domain-containing protein